MTALDPHRLAVSHAEATFADPKALAELTSLIAARVFRTDFDAPGHALLDLGTGLDAVTFRGLLIRLGEALGAEYEQRHGGELVFVSVSWFDQQKPTKPHRDGGPDASVLLLGYEPTTVPSRLYLLDYTRAAHERGLTPGEFLDCCNPAFGGDAGMLAAHTTELSSFTPGRFQIVVVNNSVLPWAERERGMLGVLHHAVVEPRPGEARPIDSVLMGVAGPGVLGLSAEQVRDFVERAVGASRYE